jgi:hypothetical protein
MEGLYERAVSELHLWTLQYAQEALRDTGYVSDQNKINDTMTRVANGYNGFCTVLSSPDIISQRETVIKSGWCTWGLKEKSDRSHTVTPQNTRQINVLCVNCTTSARQNVVYGLVNTEEKGALQRPFLLATNPAVRVPKLFLDEGAYNFDCFKQEFGQPDHPLGSNSKQNLPEILLFCRIPGVVKQG